MKGFLLLLVFITEYSVADYWTQKADLPAGERSEAIAFSIGNYGYVGTGYSTTIVYSDLWQFDPITNSWSVKSSVPNQPRYGAVAASCLGKGYVGLGNYTGFLNDWWEYDPILNAWTQKSNFPGTAREFASSFLIDSNIYVGNGIDAIQPQRDWWKYDAFANSWSPIDSTPYGCFANSAFTISGKGYLVAGWYGYKNVYEYDPILQSWTSKANFPGNGTARMAACGFSIGSYGYLGTGDTGYMSPQVKDFWQYDASTDIWYQKNDFSGIARSSAVSFTIGFNGYTGLGYSGGVRLKDLWEYTPDSITSVSSINNFNSEIIFSPNPTKGKLMVSSSQFGKKTTIDIYHISGSQVKRVQSVTGQKEISIDLKVLPSGIYFIQATSAEKVWWGKVMKD